MRRSFDRATLTSLREMPSEDALVLLAIHCKPDSTFEPIKQPTTRRWHACTSGGEFEILTTGGGAIDLAMHVLRLPFVDAVRFLIERGRPCG